MNMRYYFDECLITRKDNQKQVYCNVCTCPQSSHANNILLVHGLTYTNHIFDLNYQDYSLVRFLAQRGYTVWRMDIGGYGFSDEYEDGFEVDTRNASMDIVTILEYIIARQNIQNVDLLGWSWGCMTTAIVGAEHANLIRKMVWVGPPLGGVFPKKEITEPVTFLSYAYVTRVFQHLQNEHIDFSTIEPGLIKMWCEQVFDIDGQRGRPNGGNREIMECGDSWLIDASKVKVPTAILTGDSDFYVNQTRVKEAFSLLPEGSRLHTFHGAGHALFYEKDHYISFRETLLEFLQKSGENKTDF